MKQQEAWRGVLMHLLCCGAPLLLVLAVTTGPGLLAGLSANVTLALALVLGGLGLLGGILWRRRAGTSCGQRNEPIIRMQVDSKARDIPYFYANA